MHNVEKAKVLVKEATEICAEKEFKLTKFTNNNMELLKSIPGREPKMELRTKISRRRVASG